MELKSELQKLLAFRQMSWNLEELYPTPLGIIYIELSIIIKLNLKYHKLHQESLLHSTQLKETSKNSLDLLRISPSY